MKGDKYFNVTGLCVPEYHYMANTHEKIEQIIQKYIKTKSYFTINQARQFGKTTTLRLLQIDLQPQYIIIRISLEGKEEYFSSLQTLAGGLCFSFHKALKKQYPEYAEIFKEYTEDEYPMRALSERISFLCEQSPKGVILMIDEVDKAADNQIFMSFLGILREMYLDRMDHHASAFHNVILSGVHDIKNLKKKFRPEDEHTYNSPWNIAADFDIDMSLSVKEISSMLQEYEQDNQTGMDLFLIAQIIYDYTSGYPYLVSCLCKIMDEEILGKEYFSTPQKVWTVKGIKEAVRRILKKPSTLFDDIKKKLTDYPELRKMLYAILFNGQIFPYNIYNKVIDIGSIFGFIKEGDDQVRISNRIFETWMYNYFLSEDMVDQAGRSQLLYDKNQFVTDGNLNMDLVMEKFLEYFTDLYQENDVKFVEENGRRLFLLYLKPIINGIGNYYVEARTRNMTRTDLIVDYQAHQYVVEMKIYRGNEYHRKGEEQLADYLELYHLNKGYLLIFNFNKKKQPGIRRIYCKGKEIFEVVV